MRKGDAKSFFAQQDDSGMLLLERSRQLEESFECYSACTEEGENLVGEAWNLALEWEQVIAKEPRNLKLLSEQWEADLLFMDRQTSQVAAGSVCFPSSWDLRHAIGKTLGEVHGVVPRLDLQIGEMIKRFLEKLEPGKSYCRENQPPFTPLLCAPNVASWPFRQKQFSSSAPVQMRLQPFPAKSKFLAGEGIQESARVAPNTQPVCQGNGSIVDGKPIMKARNPTGLINCRAFLKRPTPPLRQFPSSRVVENNRAC